jgi:hypothetical protein
MTEEVTLTHPLYNPSPWSILPKDSEKAIDCEIDQGFKNEGVLPPDKQTTQTPSSINREALLKLAKTAGWVDMLFLPKHQEDDLKFVFEFCASLIAERLEMETEMDNWRKRCDSIFREMCKFGVKRGNLRR